MRIVDDFDVTIECTHELVYNLSIMIAEAPPPPLQMPAIPFSPWSRLCTKWPTIRAPDIPIGWPRETAPEEKGEKGETMFVV